MLACVYALILGGALGNLWGRMVNGYVVDFVLVHYQDYIFPAFNVADSAIFCGVGLWIVMIFREYRVEE
jgi:signal peptidase II